jgi:hypothetical protein
MYERFIKPKREYPMNKLKLFSATLVISAIVLLPNCDLFKGGETATKESQSATPSPSSSATTAPAVAQPSGPTGEVLLYMYDEKLPKVTVADFQNYKKELIEAQPNYASIIEFMPGANEQIFDSLVNEAILEEWAKKNKVDQTQAFKDDLEKIMKYAKRSLNVKFFQDKHPVTVTDAEVKKYYDENKNSIPQLMVSPGGVTAKVVMFDDKTAAQTFFDKVKDPKSNFDAAAKESNASVKDLGEVNSQSFDVDGAVRKKLLDMKRFPGVELVDVSDKSFAVVKALSKNEPKYVPYDQVKPGIENLLKQQKGAEVLTKELDKLKKEYKAVPNKEYFERTKKAQEEQAQKAAEAMKNEAGSAPSQKEQEKKPAMPMRAA